MDSNITLLENSKNFSNILSDNNRSKRVYLVYPDVNSFHGLPYHGGVASLAAVLMQQGYEVKARYMTLESEYPAIIEEILDFQPCVVGFTTVETQFGYVQDLSALIKENYSCVTVVGGSHITLCPESMLEERSSSIDCGMRGECEWPFVELVQKVQKGEDIYRVENVCYKNPDTGILIQNPLQNLDECLDEIPHPATEVFDYQGIIDNEKKALFHFNRGCPYPCTYCSAQKLALEYGSVKAGLRHRSVENVIEEIELTIANYNFPSDTLLLFSDDLFTLNKKWLYAFLDLYEKKIHRPFWCTARSNTATDEQFNRLQSSGCKAVFMAIESGNDFIRNKVMKRNVSRRIMFESFRLAEKYGLETCSPCVIGVPFETPEHIEDSLNTVAQLNVTYKACNIFYPYAGTPLRQTCEENGFLPDLTQTGIKERRESILNLPTITKEQIKFYHENWERLLCQRMGTRNMVGLKIKEAYQKYTGEKHPLGRNFKHFVDNNEYMKKVKGRVLKTLEVR